MREAYRLTRSGMLVGLAVVFQLTPVLLSELFVGVAALSALPIFIAARMAPRTGVITFLAAAVLIAAISLHESLFFVFTSGPVGLCLGICRSLGRSRFAASVIGGVTLAASLSFISFVVGIPVFKVALPAPRGLQIVILFAFSLLYCRLYLRIGDSLHEFLSRTGTCVQKVNAPD